MADFSRILSTLANLLQNAPAVVSGATNAIALARKIVETVRKPDNEITDEELDALGSASDAAHAEVQRPTERE